MRVLTVFAHHGSGSFCHAVLERFDAGLRDAGHTHDIVDLHAIKFDPVLRDRDDPNWMDAEAQTRCWRACTCGSASLGARADRSSGSR